MSPARRDECLRGEVSVEFNGVAHKREFALGPELGKQFGHFEPEDWPINEAGTRMLPSPDDTGNMRDEFAYRVHKTAEECLRSVLYKLTGRF